MTSSDATAPAMAFLRSRRYLVLLVVAAVLGGSHARGAADAHSDVDLYAIVADAAYSLNLFFSSTPSSSELPQSPTLASSLSSATPCFNRMCPAVATPSLERSNSEETSSSEAVSPTIQEETIARVTKRVRFLALEVRPNFHA